MNKQHTLPMTDEEILHSFKNAANPCKQVQILAELNATKKERIREVLIKMGVDPRRLPRERKPKPDGLTAEVAFVDELHDVPNTEREDEAPLSEEAKASPARSDLSASILVCVTEMLDKLTVSKAVLCKEVEALAAQLKAKTEELAEVEKLIPALYNCKTEVETV